jgi:hypothetical protein
MPEIDPCLKAAELRAKLENIATGGAVKRTRSGDEEVEFSAPTVASIQELRRQLEYWEEQCKLAQGQTVNRGRARSFRFRSSY